VPVAFPYEPLVRQHREQRGWTQEDLAEKVGVTRQTIANIENGLNEPRVTIAMAIAIALGATVYEIFRRKR
jgi:putative transcriptional regulator